MPGTDTPRTIRAGGPPIKLAIRDRLPVATVNVGLAHEMAADERLRDQVERALHALEDATSLLAAYEVGRTARP